MTDQPHWGEQKPRPPAAPGGAPDEDGGSPPVSGFTPPAAAENSRADDSGATATPGAAQADGANTDDNIQTDDVWPAPGVAILTTDEARLYLYQQHDMLLKERYTQKLVSDYKKLDGRPMPKAGGGQELHITQSSLDQYADDNPQKKNASDVPLDPADKLFDRLREIAQTKPFKYSIEGGAREKTKTPAPAQTAIPAVEPTAQEKNTVVAPTAPAAPAPALETVPAALHESTLKRLETMEEMNLKLYDTLDSAYDKIATMNTELLALTKQVTEKLESPATILDSMTNTLKAANNVDGQRQPITTHRVDADSPATRYSATESDHD